MFEYNVSTLVYLTLYIAYTSAFNCLTNYTSTLALHMFQILKFCL